MDDALHATQGQGQAQAQHTRHAYEGPEDAELQTKALRVALNIERAARKRDEQAMHDVRSELEVRLADATAERDSLEQDLILLQDHFEALEQMVHRLTERDSRGVGGASGGIGAVTGVAMRLGHVPPTSNNNLAM